MRKLRLNSGQLEAFIALASEKSFTKAARVLGITQPALSQRFHLLEDTLGVPLIQRTSHGLELTASGRELLIYCQIQSDLEQEVLAKIQNQGATMLVGEVRVGASSSHMRAVVIPILSKLAHKNPDLHFHFVNLSIKKLTDLLLNGSIDLILTDTEIYQSFINNDLIAEESFCMLMPEKETLRTKFFLGTDPSDPTLDDFMKIQPAKIRKKPIEKTYMGDVYSIIDAIKLGLGSAVVPLHLVPKNMQNQIDHQYVALKKNIYLSYHKQPHYSQVQIQTQKALKLEASDYF